MLPHLYQQIDNIEDHALYSSIRRVETYSSRGKMLLFALGAVVFIDLIQLLFFVLWGDGHLGRLYGRIFEALPGMTVFTVFWVFIYVGILLAGAIMAAGLISQYNQLMQSYAPGLMGSPVFHPREDLDAEKKNQLYLHVVHLESEVERKFPWALGLVAFPVSLAIMNIYWLFLFFYAFNTTLDITSKYFLR